MNRRDALSLGLKTATCAVIHPEAWTKVLPRSPALVPLAGGRKPCGKNLGIAATMQQLQDPAAARLVSSNFNMLTASGMKWHRLHPEPEVYDFSEADWNVNFALKNNMRVHGHNLCWNNAQDYPGWLSTTLNKTNARDILTRHITKVVSRYKGKIDSWDVVNEPVVPWSKREDGLYPGLWPSLLGPEYIDIAMEATEKADPAALRVMNIYHVEDDAPGNDSNREHTLRLIRELLARGVPLQAIGIESHLDAAMAPNLESFAGFLKQVQSLGLQILITEFDVKENRAATPPSQWDRVVADQYRDYLEAVLEAVQSNTIIFWSLVDRWDGQRKVQGLFQSDLRPRASYAAVQATLAADCLR